VVALTVRSKCWVSPSLGQGEPAELGGVRVAAVEVEGAVIEGDAGRTPEMLIDSTASARSRRAPRVTLSAIAVSSLPLAALVESVGSATGVTSTWSEVCWWPRLHIAAVGWWWP